MQWLFNLWWVIAAFLVGWLACHGFHRWLSATVKPKQEAKPDASVPSAPAAGQAMPLLRLIRNPKTPLASNGTVQQFPEIDTELALKAGFMVRDKTDLEVIEGVGPRMCALLHASGYPTLGALSTAKIHDLYKILHTASANYTFVKPDTWAQQAHLAASNKWYELKGLQDYLTMGVSTQIRELNTF